MIKKCSNKRYILSFGLATNKEGNKTVIKALKDFIDNQDWCTETIKVNSFTYSIK